MKSIVFYLTTILLALGWVVHAKAQTFSVLHHFSAEGAGRAISGLTLVGDTFYGAAAEGGLGEPRGGGIFSIKPDGSDYTLLYSLIGTNAAAPVGPLILDGDTLYGTTLYGRDYSGNETVFSIKTNGTGFTVLKYFDATNGRTLGPLVLTNNTIYGTAALGGVSNNGTIFSINCDGSDFTILHSFTNSNDGRSPIGLILNDETFYGITQAGGLGGGTIFQIGMTGMGFSTLHRFTNGITGSTPRRLILVGSALYGTTQFGGPDGLGGTIFSISTNGVAFTNVHVFSISSTNEGSHPRELLFADGKLYGTTEAGVAGLSRGTIYEISTNGTGFKLLHNFTPVSGAFPFETNSDGANPQGLGFSEGTLYGTTVFGGTAGYGTIFSISLTRATLTIVPSGQNILLSWSTNSAGFTLQSTTNLTSPIWELNCPTPVVVNGENTVTNPISGVQKFFRLAR